MPREPNSQWRRNFYSSLLQNLSCERRRKIGDTGHPALQCAAAERNPQAATLNVLLPADRQPSYNLELMKRIDESFLESPFFCSGQMRSILRDKSGVIAYDASCARWGWWRPCHRPKTGQPHPPRRIRACYRTRRFQGRTGCGAPASRAPCCGTASRTLRQVWTDTAEQHSLGACSVPWMRLMWGRAGGQ